MRLSLAMIGALLSTSAYAEDLGLEASWQAFQRAAHKRFETSVGAAEETRLQGARQAQKQAPSSLEALRISVAPELNPATGDEGEIGAELALSWRLGRGAAQAKLAKVGQAQASATLQQARLRFLEEGLKAWVQWLEGRTLEALAEAQVAQARKELASYEANLKQGQVTWLVVSGLEAEVARFELEASVMRLQQEQARLRLAPYLHALETTKPSLEAWLELGKRVQARWGELAQHTQGLPLITVERLKAEQSLAQAKAMRAEDGVGLEVGLSGRHAFDPLQSTTFAGVLVGVSLPLQRSSASEQARLAAEASAQRLDVAWQEELLRAELLAEAKAFELRQEALNEALTQALEQARARAERVQDALRQGRVQVEAQISAGRDVMALEREVVRAVAQLLESAWRSQLWAEALKQAEGETR